MAYPNLKQSVWLLILLLLIGMALGVPVAILGFILDVPLHQSPYLMWILSLASFVLTAIYAHRRTDRNWDEILLLKPVSRLLYLPLVVSVVGLAIVCTDLGTLMRQLIPVPEILLNLIRDLAGKETPYLFAFFVIVVKAPLAEEVFFRGVILGGLLAHRTRIRATVWSAFLFALFHANAWQFPVALILGLVFAWWVIQTGSLIPALVGHALNNFLSLTVARMELFGPMDDFNTVVFLPWWLNVCGIVLALVGLAWFKQVAQRESKPVDAPDDRESV